MFIPKPVESLVNTARLFRPFTLRAVLFFEGGLLESRLREIPSSNPNDFQYNPSAFAMKGEGNDAETGKRDAGLRIPVFIVSHVRAFGRVERPTMTSADFRILNRLSTPLPFG